MSLGHKQLEENPWETFESVFPVGTVHQGTYVRNEDKDAIIAMPYGLEAICFMSNRKIVRIELDTNFPNFQL